MNAEKNPNMMDQILVMAKRRFRQFRRDPKNWFLLATPFITATFGFLIVYKIQEEFPTTDPSSDEDRI